MPVPKGTPPRVEVDGRSAPTGLSTVFDVSPNSKSLKEYIRWANGRRARQPNGKGKTEVTNSFELAAKPFFAKKLSDRELTMNVRDCGTDIVYRITILVPYFDFCDHRSLLYAFNGHSHGMYHWIELQFNKVLSTHLNRVDVVIKTTGTAAFMDVNHGWIQNVVGLPNSPPSGPLNGITQYAYNCAGFKECIVGHRFTWIAPVSSSTGGVHGVAEDASSSTPDANDEGLEEEDAAQPDIEDITTEDHPPHTTSVEDDGVVSGGVLREVELAQQQHTNLLPQSVLPPLPPLRRTATLDAAIQMISDTALVDPNSFSEEHVQTIHRLSKFTFASAADAQLMNDIGGTADADDDDGPDVLESWESTAFALNRIYEERNAAFPDECVSGKDLAPVNTNRLHLIRFRSLAVRFQGKLLKTSRVREHLCETDEGKADLQAAGLISIATNGRSTSRFWILDEAQMKRVVARARVASIEQLPTNLLERCKFEVDHLLNNQNFGRRGVMLACDTLLNYCLIPRWLNVHPQFLHTYTPAKIATIGLTGHLLLRSYMMALNNSKVQRVRDKLAELFANPHSCQRDELSKSIKRILGPELVSDRFGKRLAAAITSFQPNENSEGTSSRGQRRIDSMLKRKRDIEAEAGVEAGAETEEEDRVLEI